MTAPLVSAKVTRECNIVQTVFHKRTKPTRSRVGFVLRCVRLSGNQKRLVFRNGPDDDLAVVRAGVFRAAGAENASAVGCEPHTDHPRGAIQFFEDRQLGWVPEGDLPREARGYQNVALWAPVERENLCGAARCRVKLTALRHIPQC